MFIQPYRTEVELMLYELQQHNDDSDYLTPKEWMAKTVALLDGHPDKFKDEHFFCHCNHDEDEECEKEWTSVHHENLYNAWVALAEAEKREYTASLAR